MLKTEFHDVSRTGSSYSCRLNRIEIIYVIKMSDLNTLWNNEAFHWDIPIRAVTPFRISWQICIPVNNTVKKRDWLVSFRLISSLKLKKNISSNSIYVLLVLLKFSILARAVELHDFRSHVICVMLSCCFSFPWKNSMLKFTPTSILKVVFPSFLENYLKQYGPCP